MILDIISIMQVVTDAVSRTITLTSCDTIVPIYASTIYDGTCDYSISALMWLFSGMLTVAFVGMWMLTLRSAYKPTRYIGLEEENDYDDNNDEMEDDSRMKRHNSNGDNHSVDDSLYY